VNIVLIGNKCDLSDRRAITAEQGAALAKEYNIQFFETSAKQDINVQEAFGALVRQVSDRLFGGDTKPTGPDNTVQPGPGNPQKQKCC